PPPARTRPAAPGIPSQLGVVFAAPERDWHGRAGWNVELLYCRADAAALGGRGAEEPRTDLPDPRWPRAQAGFRVYRDWLAVVNRYGSTAGRPIFISATNTFVADAGVPPAQNYPAGWL